MKPSEMTLSTQGRRSGFTLVELMVAMSVGLVVAGTVVMLLVQASREQRRGFAATTVEENAHNLQARITSALRSMSANFGITPDINTPVTNSSGNVVGYRAIVGFKANGGGTYTSQRLGFDASSGNFSFTPSYSTAPANQIVWMTSGQKVVLRKLFFRNSLNPDLSQNNSLINVSFQMDDNGFSQQNLTNNPANIIRSFAVQMRCD
ncbi:MAG: prepilin-type N-terminal cleavage/methylation domain-containing protein [Limisphaerales bacterium]